MRRRSINPSKLKPHKNPIPMACLVDNILMTSAIQGHDPKTGKFSLEKVPVYHIVDENEKRKAS